MLCFWVVCFYFIYFFKFPICLHLAIYLFFLFQHRFCFVKYPYWISAYVVLRLVKLQNFNSWIDLPYLHKNCYFEYFTFLFQKINWCGESCVDFHVYTYSSSRIQKFWLWVVGLAKKPADKMPKKWNVSCHGDKYFLDSALKIQLYCQLLTSRWGCTLSSSPCAPRVTFTFITLNN